MARTYASIALRIWSDDRFRARSMPAQWLYLRLVSDPRLSLAGVTEWNPKRIARSAGETSRDDVDAARAELEHHRFICIDDDTDEVAVRSFMRNDKTLASSKTAVGVAAALDGVESPEIRGALSLELHRMARDERPPNGLEVVHDFMAHNPPAEFPYPDTTRKGHPVPHQEGVSEGVSDTGVAEPEPEPEPKPEPEPMRDAVASSGAARVNDADDRANDDEFALLAPEDAGPSLSDKFGQFYDAYPRKRDRAKAEKAFEDAVRQKRQDPDQLITAAQQLAADPNLPEKQYIPYPASWLNAERWNDPPYEPRQQNLPASQKQFQISAERHERIMRGELGAPPRDDDPSLWLPPQIEEA